jgi:hypothetical protein
VRASAPVLRRSVVRATLVPALCLVVALVQTTPLALHVTTSVPFGNYPAPTVVWLNLWNLWWNSERLLHAYAGYWAAPIFHPDPYAFAYTEALWLPGLVASGLWWTTASPALAYNAVLLAAFVLNGWCGYLLLRRLRIAFWAAVCGGLVMEMLPIAADQIGVLQSAALFPIPMTLACLLRFGRSGKPWPALGAVLWMAVCYHVSSNTALFFGPAAAFALVVFAGRRLARARSAATLALAALLGALLVAPVAVVQSRVLAKGQAARPESMIAATSARLEAYAKMPASNLLRRRPPDRRAYSLYPGTGVLLLAAAGSCYGLRRRRLRRWTVYSLLVVLTYVLLSFGPLAREQPLGALLSGPYELLRDYYPGFRFARNLWRFGGLAQVFLAPLVGFGLAGLAAPSGRFRRAVLPALVALALGVELLAAPIPLLDLRGKPTDLRWVQWLRSSPPETTIIHLPMANGLLPEDFERTGYWMYCQMYHGRRMANGYAGFVPGHTVQLAQLMERFPDAESIHALRYLGINHVLASGEWMASAPATGLAQWTADVVPELATGEMTIYRIGAREEGQ